MYQTAREKEKSVHFLGVNRAIGKLLREVFRRYQARRHLRCVEQAGQKAATAKGFTPKNFGSAFED